MKTNRLTIAVAVVLIACLGGVAVRLNSRLAGERARSAELQGKVDSLEQEVAKLKQTSEYYYQHGIDLQSSGNLTDAQAAFEAVVAKFPASNLVASAQERLTAVNAAIAKAEADRAAETQRQQAAREEAQLRQQQEQEKLEREQGEQIEYKLFYAKAKSTGLPIGKRFRFRAFVNLDLLLEDGSGNYLSGEAAFDDEGQHERFLQGPDKQFRTVVASMGYDGRVQIHRIE